MILIIGPGWVYGMVWYGMVSVFIRCQPCYALPLGGVARFDVLIVVVTVMDPSYACATKVPLSLLLSHIAVSCHHVPNIT